MKTYIKVYYRDEDGTERWGWLVAAPYAMLRNRNYILGGAGSTFEVPPDRVIRQGPATRSEGVCLR